MYLLKIMLLAVFQGLTEFLPVSSSGHLVLLQKIFRMENNNMMLDIFLHFGTLLSVLLIFRKDIYNLIIGFFSSLNLRNKNKSVYKKLSWLIIIANIPAGIIGIFFRKKIEAVFGNYYIVCFLLIFTGIILFLTRFVKVDKYRLNDIGVIKAILIGCAQALAILPGISRSGSTISAAILLKINREISARFSFLIMIPAILGATILELKDISFGNIDAFPLIIGVLISFVTGYFSILLLLKLVKSYKLHLFSYYCAAVGILGIIIRNYI